MPNFSDRTYPSHSLRDRRTGVYYLRFRYPKPLREAWGRSEFKRSLNTKDRDTARFLSGYVYRFLKPCINESSSMDIQRASVYFSETFDRLLRRAQYALMTGDSLGLNDYQVHLPKPTTGKVETVSKLPSSDAATASYDDFKVWCEHQLRLIEETNTQNRLQQIQLYHQQRQSEHSDSTVNGLAQTSQTQEAAPVTVEIDNLLDLPEAGSLAQSSLKPLVLKQPLSEPVDLKTFEIQLVKAQARLFETVASLHQQSQKEPLTPETLDWVPTVDVLLTSAHEVKQHLSSYLETVRNLNAYAVTNPKQEPFIDPAQWANAQPQQGQNQALFNIKPMAPITPTAPQTELDNATPIDPLPFAELFTEFIATKSKVVGKDSIRQYGIIENWFVKEYSKDFDCRGIDKKLANSIKGRLLKKRSKDSKGYKQPTIAVKTINKYIGYLSEFFLWLQNHYDGFENRANPFSGLRIKESKNAVAHRVEFSAEEMNLMLTYNFANDDKNNPKDAKGYRQAAHWFPKIAAFTGMRLNEIAEIRACDVYQMDGVWVIKIADTLQSETSKSNKSDSAIRVIPVHQSLIDFGFIEFVQHAQSKKRTKYLFNELFKGRKSMPSGGWGTPMSRWFNRTLLNKRLGIKVANKDFHSFRTSFICKLKEAGVDAYLAKQIVGHAKQFKDMTGKDVTFDIYGSGVKTKISVLQAIVNQVGY